jgi:hypothetical protein
VGLRGKTDPIPHPRSGTITADIVIIGTARRTAVCSICYGDGLEVVALEKLPKAIGTSFYSRASGLVWICRSRLYAQRGIKLDKAQLAGAQSAPVMAGGSEAGLKIINYGEKVANWWLDNPRTRGVDLKHNSD